MNFIKDNWYHIYNRGNNKQSIFFEERNYILFLEKTRKHIFPFCDIVAYSLMPNHFHFLVVANAATVQLVPNQTIPLTNLGNGIRHLLSSYTKAINKQEGFSGNLFQQKTKSKCIFDSYSMNNEEYYNEICFHYIHQNPLKAGLVNKMEEWRFSSFQDYAGLRNGTLCDTTKWLDFFNYNKNDFLNISSELIGDDKAGLIF